MMKVCVHSLFADIPVSLPGELFQTLLQQDSVRLERIVSRGHHSAENDWYDQTQDEWVALLQGEARLEIEGQGILQLQSGDYLLLPAHCRHRVAWTSIEPPCIWLALHVAKKFSSGAV